MAEAQVLQATVPGKTKSPAPCGSVRAAGRHRSRGEALDAACADAWNAYCAQRYAAAQAPRRAATERDIARAVAAANRRRQPARRISLGGPKAIALGALAGTTVAHGFLPDGSTGTTCMACFGWSNDYRHTHSLWIRQ